MKELVNTLLVGIGLCAFSLTAEAQFTFSAGKNANTVTSVISSNTATINSISVQNTNPATLATIAFYDAKWTNLVYTNGTWIQTAFTNGNTVQWYTNVLGIVNSNVFLSSIGYSVTNAAATNFFPVVYTATVNSNTTATYTPPGGHYVSRGLAFTNSAGVIVTVNYDQ